MLRHLSRATAVQLQLPISILNLEEVGAGLGAGLFRLMLHEVAQHPGNGWWWLLQLSPSPYRSRRVEVETGDSSMDSSSEIERNPTRHVPSHWNSLVVLLKQFNYFADFPCRCIAYYLRNPTKTGKSLN